MRIYKTLIASLLGSILQITGCSSAARDAEERVDDPTEPEAPAAACGDGVLDDGELCDGAALDGTSCESLGYAAGALRCRVDCQGLVTQGCELSSSVAEVAVTDLALPIPDDAYDGTVESMACVELTFEGAPKYGFHGSAQVRLGIDHPWAGDIVVKTIAPSGRVRTFLHRAGRLDAKDDGDGDGGVGADLSKDHPILLWSGGISAEQMGQGLGPSQVICKDDEVCDFHADAGPTTWVSTEEELVGTWKVCVGDAGAGDAGTLHSVALEGVDLTPAPVAREVAANPGLVIPDGAFDGTVGSMACAPLQVVGDARELSEVGVVLGIEHPRASQLVMALVDPDGGAYTLASRPSVDEDERGASADPGQTTALSPDTYIAIEVAAPHPLASAETLADGACDQLFCYYAADAGGGVFQAPERVVGHVVTGLWKVCVGDAVTGNEGKLGFVLLSLDASL